MKELKGLTASNRVEERILKIPDLVNKAAEDLEKVSKIPDLVNKATGDLKNASKLLTELSTELLEKLEALKSHFVALRDEQQKLS